MKLNKNLICLGLLPLLGLSSCCGLQKQKLPEVEKHRPLTCLRIAYTDFSTPELRERVCRVFDRYGKPDEVWLDSPDGMASLTLHKKVIEDCQAFSKMLKERGIAVSFQLTSTIGHTPGRVYPEKDSFQWQKEDLLVGHDGKTVPSTCCPTSPGFSKWCNDVAAMYCKEIQPLAAFIDDDMRLHEHGPLKQTCCCKRCLDRFGKMTGRTWTQKEVYDMLESKDVQPFRRQWVELHTQIIAEFYEKIASAIHAVSPGTYVGIQNQNAKYFYSAWNFTPVFEAIKRATGRPARVRIGGGGWSDFDPSILVRKSFISGCDIDTTRESGLVDLIGYEEESYPSHIMRKHPHSKALEFALHLANGGNYLTCQTSLTWNDYDNAMGEILATFKTWNPLFLRLRELSSKYRFDGITALVQDGIIEYPAHKDFPWYVFWAVESEQLQRSSLPLRLSKVASQKGNNPGYLTWETARGISEENFKKFLRAGIVVTGNAYLELQKRGLTKDFKVKAQKHPGSWVNPVFLKGPFAGTSWVPGKADVIGFTIEKDSKAEALMQLSPKNKTVTAWRLETPEGKIAVIGTPGDFNRNLSHLALDFHRDMFDWVGKKPVSVRLENAAAVVLMPLADENGRIRAVSILNTGTGTEKKLKLRIRRPYSAKAQWYQVDKDAVKVCGKMVDKKDECVFTLPELGSWQFALLELK